MAQRSMRGADALVRSLQDAGVRRLFTLSGNHIMPVFDAALDAGIELIHTRHEAATVHMADAWARLTGEIGVALVTGGPDTLTRSQRSTPRTWQSGGVATLRARSLFTARPGAFQEMQQAEIAKP
jgi:acetolactate synthase-1/2/3 large subunit